MLMCRKKPSPVNTPKATDWQMIYLFITIYHSLHKTATAKFCSPQRTPVQQIVPHATFCVPPAAFCVPPAAFCVPPATLSKPSATLSKPSAALSKPPFVFSVPFNAFSVPPAAFCVHNHLTRGI